MPKTKAELAAYQQEWLARGNNREKAQRRWRENRRRLRREATEALGGRCVHCGLDDFRCLQIDHVNDDGYDDRKRDGSTWYQKMVRRIIAGDTAPYQLLCANCNWIKRFDRGDWS